MPSLRQLEYLVALSQTRHFRRAADRCGVSQPTLSAQIAELERRLGVQLIERARGAVLLTPVGERILAHAKSAVQAVVTIRELASSHRGGLSGVVRLGLPHSIGPNLLPYLIGPLHESYPDLRLYVREDFPDALPDALESGEHDFIIVPVPIRNGDFESLSLFREPLHLVAPADHPLAGLASVDKTALSGQPILALAQGHQLRTQVETLCEEFGAELQTAYEGTSLDTLRQMTAMGLGLTVLPDLYVRRALVGDTAIKLITLKGRTLYRTIGLVWRKSSPLGEVYRKLVADIRAALRTALPELIVG